MNQSPGLGVVTIGRDLSIQSWNQWLAEATGLSEAAVTGRSLLSLVPAERADLVRAVLEDVLSTGTSRVLAPAFHRHLIACPPQTPSHAFAEMQQFVTLAPLHASGGIVGALITIEDVTARLDRDRALTTRLESGALAPADAVAAIGAPDWRLRGAAVRSLRQRASSAEIEHLLTALTRGYTDLNVVGGALQVLAAANCDVTPALVELLSHSAPDLRMHAALALGQAGDRAAIPALVRALEDDNANVTFHAIEALGLLGAGDAVEALSRIAQSGDFFLAFPAIDALAKADDPRVAPALTSLLDNALLRPAVIQTLAASGDEDAVAPLVTILGDDPDSVMDVAAALARIRERYEDAFGAGAHIVDLTRGALTPRGLAHLADAVTARRTPLAPVVTVLGWTGQAALDALIGVLGEPVIDAIATDAIAAVGCAAVEPLIARLATGDQGARMSVVALLGRLGDRRAVGPLMATLDSVDAELTSAAAVALARLGDPAALDALLPLFAHPQAAVRQAALAAVNSIGADATAARIAPRLADHDARVRACAVRVIGYFGFEEIIGGIFEALDDEDEEVRRAALEQLPVLDDPRAMARLADAVRSETPRNRAAAAHALRSVDRLAAAAALVEALDDDDMWVRYFAAGSIARRRDAAAAPMLARRAETDPAPHVRIAALQALSEVDLGMAGTISRALVRDADRDVAVAALAALATSAAADADDLFEEAVRSPDVALRRGAVQALSLRASARAVEMLAWAARAPDPADLPRLATDSLARLAGASDSATRQAALDALVELATTPATREDALSALSALPGAADHLAAALSSPREATRIAVAEALARMRNAHASGALVAALADASASVRGAAVAAFGRLGASVAADAIAELGVNDQDAGCTPACGCCVPPSRMGNGFRESASMTELSMRRAASGQDVKGIRIPERTLELLRDLVLAQTGMFYDDSRLDFLRDRLAPLAVERGFDSFLDYYYLLKYDAEAAQEWVRAIDALSVQETYFWREADQIEAVAGTIVPQLVASHRWPIRIWSVPCATGEEPLSLAIALEEAGWFGRVPIEIHGSDASEAALQRARTGRYGGRAFRQLPEALREKYFDHDAGARQWVVKPEIHRRIKSWTRVNVARRDEIVPFGSADVIFCRNLFIYFTPSTVTQVVDAFADLMPSPAYLCVGAAESLLRLTTRFDLREMGGAYVYCKP